MLDGGVSPFFLLLLTQTGLCGSRLLDVRWVSRLSWKPFSMCIGSIFGPSEMSCYLVRINQEWRLFLIILLLKLFFCVMIGVRKTLIGLGGFIIYNVLFLSQLVSC